MTNLLQYKKQILIGLLIVLMLVSIGIAVYLVQRQQQLKSKASGGSYVGAFEFTDSKGNTINCDSSTTPPTCTTQDLDINVRVKNPSLLLP